jgi:hypothetical protein
MMSFKDCSEKRLTKLPVAWRPPFDNLMGGTAEGAAMILDFRLERELHFSSANTTVTASVSVGGIVQETDCFACQYDFPIILSKPGRIYGEDPLHALSLCLKHIRALIDNESADDNMDIWWLEPGDHGGF